MPTRVKPEDVRRVVESLVRQYPDCPHDAVVRIVAVAAEGVRAFGLSADDDAVRVLSMIAENEVRLALGLCEEAARLDPERRRRA
jgi:hypothetical protein